MYVRTRAGTAREKISILYIISSPHQCIFIPYATPYLFFFNDTATTEIYTLSLHDALPIYQWDWADRPEWALPWCGAWGPSTARSEEHTSELQSQSNLVCRLLLEKKKSIQSCDLDVLDSQLS